MSPEDVFAAMPLTAPQRARFAALFEPRDHDAMAHLVLQGAPFEDVFLIERGLVRFFYTRQDGREFNKSFLSEGDLGGSLSAYLTDGIAPFGVQALEPTRIWRARYERVAALYEDEDRAFERLGRYWLEQLALKKERRERALLEEDATTRYLHFLDEYPDLANRLPLYHVARYVGVTEVSLSRIRARLARGQ